MSTSALTPTEDGDLKEQDPSLSEDKVVVLFKPTGGDTPLLKQTKVKVLRSAKFVFVYLNDAFTPSYDEQVGRLFDWFGSGSGGEGEFETNGGSARKKKQMLVVNYSAQQAYG